MKAKWSGGLAAALVVAAYLLGGVGARAQFSNFNQGVARSVLDILKGDIKKNYYDPAYRGADLDQMFNEAKGKIDAATSTGQLLGIIAQTLLNFDDSHTFFLPPERSYRVEYGWQMQMIGEDCVVTAVKPGSDADLKGLKPGDQVVSLDGYEPTRDILWKMHYSYYQVRPVPGMHVIVRSPEGEERELDVLAKVTQGKRVMNLASDDIWQLIREGQSEARLYRHRFQEKDDELLIWKMPAFDLTEKEVDDRMHKSKKFKTLILDLRGNGGGAVKTLERMVGYFFDHDLKIADLKGRKKMDPQEAKTRGDDVFPGKVIVLVDSNSASAAEILARLMQLEKRGTVIGDRTAGAVMQSAHYDHQLGADVVIFYGANVTNADVIMSDGQSLEKVGVTPDELLLPSMEDMAEGRDPVLAHAAELAGVNLSAEQAGAMFPIEWRP